LFCSLAVFALRKFLQLVLLYAGVVPAIENYLERQFSHNNGPNSGLKEQIIEQSQCAAVFYAPVRCIF